MAKFHNVNQLPTTGPMAMYSVKTTLVAAGWVVSKSGDGLALYSAGGDILTGGGTGAGGLGNARAYFTIRDAATGVAFSFQMITNTTWRVKYSETGAMAGGSPDSTTTGTATDEQLLYGAGTDASPTGTQMLHTDNTYRFHVVANSTVQAGNGTYPFWFGGSIVSTGVQASFFGLDGIANGTFHPLDTVPRAIITWYVATGPVPGGWFGNSDTVFYARAWVAYGLGNASFKRMMMSLYSGNASSSTGGPSPTISLSQSPYTPSEDQPLPILVLRSAANGTLPGPKGFLADLQTATQTASERAYPLTILNASNAYVYFGGLLAPWPENVSASL